MQKLLAILVLLATTAATLQAQGFIRFQNSPAASTKISTNVVVGGAATGLTQATAGKFIYALFYSTSAYDVMGQTAPIVGAANNGYAFNDARWKFAGYATNTATAGRLLGQTQSDGTTVIPAVAGGGAVQVVVVGWSSDIGTTLPAVMAWFNNGNPVSAGLIGQSAVSGTAYLGDGGAIVTPSVFGVASGQVAGFVLGQIFSYELFSPPIISLQATNQTVSVGGTASFVVKADADLSLSVAGQWRLNGTNISNAGNYIVTSTNYPDGYFSIRRAIYTLTVTNAQVTNVGNYSVFISNAAGFATSADASLTVTGITGTPPILSAQPASQSIGAGSNVTFSVSASGSTPLSYQWTFNGTNLANAIGASLTLSNVQPANAGNYAVTITNAFGATNSANAALTVLTFPPAIITQPASASVQVGNGITFSVAASGTVPLSYQWKLNGTTLPGATSASYSISNAQTNNSGSYSVTVSNPYGTTNSANATLAVFPPSGYVFFLNNNNSATKIFTNSDVGGVVTGLTTTNGGKYIYALFASATATNVNGQINATLGNAGEYAFNDSAWTLVAYGTNTFRAGRLASTSSDFIGRTPVTGFPGGSAVQLVVIGWSANIGSDIPAVQNWYGSGNPAFDGWIGESAVSGAIYLGDGGIIPSPAAFGSAAPALQGFTLGLVQPVASLGHYSVSVPPAPVLTPALNGNSLKLSWPTAAGSYVVQSASKPSGPWSDTGLNVTLDGANSTVTLPPTNSQQFFRLIVQ